MSLPVMLNYWKRKELLRTMNLPAQISLRLFNWIGKVFQENEFIKMEVIKNGKPREKCRFKNSW